MTCAHFGGTLAHMPPEQAEIVPMIALFPYQRKQVPDDNEDFYTTFDGIVYTDESDEGYTR